MVTLYRLLSTLYVRGSRHSGLDPESPRTFRNDPTLRHIEGILNQVQDDGGTTAYAASLRSDRFGSDATNDKQLSLASRGSHSGPDPESPRTFRNDPTLRHIRGILNRVQDDGGATAYAASLHSDRFGSNATNDKQLSLASRVSHSGLDPESPRSLRSTSDPRRSQSSIATTGYSHRSRAYHHGFVGFGRIRPTLREAYQNHSLSDVHAKDLA